ncbi:MAG: hypothetical protein N0E48_26945 [Candidatus Thiodiazotropha endolucinida]|nr:hypothetical protein [Candidatus Thiodiazotropha taylori]MCW4346965.1 hypothetical protein [Candidatus Thiodiazotropha endolucinida]
MSNKKKIKSLEAQVEALKEELRLEKVNTLASFKTESVIDEDPFSGKMGNMSMKTEELTPSASAFQPFPLPSGMMKATEVKPTSFKGSVSEDWTMWLRNYEVIANLNKWPDQFKLTRLVTVLEGDANSKYWECSETERGDWDSLVKALTKKFAPESNRATFQAALETKLRKKEESLDSYMNSIKTLARKAFPDWDGSYRDIMVKKYFIDGLEESLRLWVLQANPKSADEALQVALRTEANMRQKTQAAATAAATVNQTNQTTSTTDLAEAIALALEKRGIGNQQNFPMRSRGRARGSFRGRGQSRRPGRVICHSCGQEGHYWRDAICPNSPKNQGNDSGTGGWN